MSFEKVTDECHEVKVEQKTHSVGLTEEVEINMSQVTVA
jgi:hypothetical protein